MYHRILVPVDGSPFAEEVIPHAQGLASAIGATLTILCVAESESKLAEAEDYVTGLAGSVGAEGRAVVVRGDVPATILDEVAADPDTLPAITAHGRSGLATAMLGSVARELVQSGNIPVLVYRPQGKAGGRGTPGRIRTVVLPLDGSGRSESMQQQAAEWAKALGADLVLVQVVQEGVRADRLLAEYDLSEDSYVRAHAAEIKRWYGVEASWEVLHGDPVNALATYLRDRDDVLVIMATRSQPALRAAVLGSVTSGLMHQASVPVIVQAPLVTPTGSVSSITTI